MSAAIMHRIEQASARALSGVVAELGYRAGELTRKMQETAEKEAEQVVNRAVVGKGGAPQQDKAVAEAGDNSQGIGPAVGIGDFDQWLAH